MTLMIDPPLWPAHGRRWSHLISDTSFAELHAFARALGIPERGFDGDHYDVPESEYHRMIDGGAVPVSSPVLVQALRAAGLRRQKRKGERVLASVALPPEGEGEPEMKEITPEIDELEGFKVNKKGQVLDEEGEPIGELIEGDAAKCAGKKINEKGEVVDKDGNVLGKVKALPKMVEASEVPEPEVKEVEVTPDINELEGLKVNKKGQVLDEEGEPIGELIEGDAKE